MVIQVEKSIFDAGADVIAHQVNCRGVMGSGVAKQVRSIYPWVFAEYRDFCAQVPSECSNCLLGQRQYVYIDETHRICNLFAQDRFGYDGNCYTDYGALRSALMKMNMDNHGKVIAIPYLMGCHRGGGDWNVVEKMLHDIFDQSNNTIMICKYNGG